MSRRARGVIRLDVELELRDKEGKLISKRRFPSKSLLRNFLKCLRDYMISKTQTCLGTAISTYQGVSAPIMAVVKNLVNADANLTLATVSSISDAFSISLIGLDPPSGIDAWGLVVGWGTLAVTPNDYTLQNKYAEGSGSGQLAHGSGTVEDVAVSDMTTRFRVIRTFTNNYSAPQTVAEIGMIARYTIKYCVGGTPSPTTVTVYFLTARDVLSPAQSIPVGATLTVRYIFSVTA